MSDYNELEPQDMTPGTLCTVLEVRRKRMRPSIMGDVALIPAQHEQPSAGQIFMGWPLRVRHREKGTPFIVLDVLDNPENRHFPCTSTLLDARKVKFAPISSEYVRQVLNQPYRTTL